MIDGGRARILAGKVAESVRRDVARGYRKDDAIRVAVREAAPDYPEQLLFIQEVPTDTTVDVSGAMDITIKDFVGVLYAQEMTRVVDEILAKGPKS